ncbi:MAG: TraR/DksA family transcriptional regulator [Bacteroidia bacterium]|nr:TraR/DksA family transcriptional regulator [Bacteroidia bacterium]MCX7652052.1 TraR/DksA family transcriptional regulator [Bacteroidia bacterium]MDW8416277.1 TraR/DksA family transcriptional regulator [Bacteroidia bacterium]
MSTPEKTRYTAEELAEFKRLILTKLEEAEKEYQRLKESLGELVSAAEDQYRTGEYMGSEYSEKVQLERLLQHNLKYIDALKRALIRIENGTYGICKVTGKLIPKERLLAVPVAETIVEVKEKRSK